MFILLRQSGLHLLNKSDYYVDPEQTESTNNANSSPNSGRFNSKSNGSREKQIPQAKVQNGMSQYET